MPRAIALLLLLSFPVAALAQTQRKPAVTDVDSDGDGWTPSQGDCCDSTLTCPNPALVNPGALEIAGNGIDDDCDGTIDNALPACDSGLASNSSTGSDYAKAIDLCQFTIENPTIDQKRWGLISAQFFLADGTGTPAAVSRSIRPAFGNNLPPSGVAFTLLSTGAAAAPGQTNPSAVSPEPGLNNGTQSGFPSDWLAANGGTIPTVPSCPSPVGTAANDPVMLKLRIRVPTNMRSFSVSSRYFTSEFAEWVCTAFTDVSLILLDSGYAGASPNPADKNIGAVVTPAGRFIVSPNLAKGDSGYFQACVNGTVGCNSLSSGLITTCTSTAALSGTGYDTATPGNCDANSLLGGATAWLTTVGNVVPGETIELRFIVWDTSDGSFDSLELLDNFQWWPDTLAPGTYITGAAPLPVPAGVVATASGTSVSVSWNAVGSASSYQVFRRAPGGAFSQVGTTSGPAYSETATADTAYLYRVRAVNAIGTSLDSAADLATTVAFTDNPLAGGTTFIKAAHLTELRTAVDAVRNLASLTPFSFTDTPAADLPIKAVHVTELRSALDAALTALGFPAGGYTDAVAADVAVRSVHFQELRDRVN